MKNTVKVMAAVMAFAGLSAMLNGCASMDVADNDELKLKCQAAAEYGTPDNSVIFYGCFVDGNKGMFSQMDPAYGPDQQDGFNKLGLFISTPVTPGSTYALTYGVTEYTYLIGNHYYTDYQTSVIPMNTGLKVNVPKEPGLYYIGLYSLSGSCTNNEWTENKLVIGGGSAQKKSLQMLLKYYEGTEWEAVIQNELEKL